MSLNTYHRIRDRIRPGDCLTWVADSWTLPVGHIIQWFAPKGYHGCEHIASVITAPQYSDRKLMIEAKGNTGVVPIAISHRLEESSGKCQVFWHPLNPEIVTFDQRIEMERWLWQQCWKKYDFSGCGAQAASYISEDLKKLFCSELCGGSIRHGFKGKMKPTNDIQRKAVEKFEAGYALRPWDVVALPIFLPMVRIF